GTQKSITRKKTSDMRCSRLSNVGKSFQEATLDDLDSNRFTFREEILIAHLLRGAHLQRLHGSERPLLPTLLPGGQSGPASKASRRRTPSLSRLSMSVAELSHEFFHTTRTYPPEFGARRSVGRCKPYIDLNLQNGRRAP